MPVFERAQELAGDNLSATIAQALRRFVEMEDTKQSGFEEVTVKVGKIAPLYKRFRGRLLAKGHVHEKDDTREVSYRVYLTAKENLALYVRDTPNWNYWSNPKSWSYRNHRHHDWTNWSHEDQEYRLEVYETVEQLRSNVPQELYEAVAQALKGGPDGAEFLDI